MNLPIRPSAIELQHLEQVSASAGWGLIVRKIESMKATAWANLRGSKSWDEFLEARGKLTALERILQVPDILKTEITENLERQEREDRSR